MRNSIVLQERGSEEKVKPWVPKILLLFRVKFRGNDDEGEFALCTKGNIVNDVKVQPK